MPGPISSFLLHSSHNPSLISAGDLSYSVLPFPHSLLSLSSLLRNGIARTVLSPYTLESVWTRAREGQTVRQARETTPIGESAGIEAAIRVGEIARETERLLSPLEKPSIQQLAKWSSWWEQKKWCACAIIATHRQTPSAGSDYNSCLLHCGVIIATHAREFQTRWLGTSMVIQNHRGPNRLIQLSFSANITSRVISAI